MSALITRKATTMNRMLPLLAAAGWLLAATAQAAAPGISGNTITLTASPAYLTQPDGQSVYSWGYGCTGGALASGQSFVPATTTTPFRSEERRVGKEWRARRARCHTKK